MLFLQFRVGMDRFVVETSRVVEVLPLVYWKQLPGAAGGLAGILNYRCTPVPLIDLSILMLGHPSPERMSTRIIVVSTDSVSSGRLGLIGEQVVSTVHSDPASFVVPDDVTMTVPYLGPVLVQAYGVIQWLYVDHLVAPEARTQLVEPHFAAP